MYDSYKNDLVDVSCFVEASWFVGEERRSNLATKSPQRFYTESSSNLLSLFRVFFGGAAGLSDSITSVVLVSLAFEGWGKTLSFIVEGERAVISP